MIMDPKKIQNDIKKLKGSSDGNGSMSFDFEYLNAGKEVVGMLVVPEKDGVQQDFYVINELYRFGNKAFIPRNENNDRILKSIAEDIDEQIEASKSQDNKTRYSLYPTVKVQIYNPQDNKNSIKILTISFNQNVDSFLTSLYKIYGEIGDEILNRFIKISMDSSYNLSVMASSKTYGFTQKSILTKNHGEKKTGEILERLQKFMVLSKEYDEHELKSKVMIWAREVLRDSKNKDNKDDTDSFNFGANKNNEVFNENGSNFDENGGDNSDFDFGENVVSDDEKNTGTGDDEIDKILDFDSDGKNFEDGFGF